MNRNAGENVKKSQFWMVLKKQCTHEKFEECLSELVKENELEANARVVKIYENKSLWATVSLRDKFFGRIRTMSQCEVVNAILKTYVRKKWCIF